MIVASRIITDANDATPLNKIEEDYTVATQFAFTISDKSLKETTLTTTGTSHNIFRRNGSGGLNWGAIVGVVISIIAVVAIAGIVVSLTKKGILAGTTASSNSPSIQNSSIQGFYVNNKVSNIV